MGKKRDLEETKKGETKVVKKQATLSFGGGGDVLPGSKYGKPLL